MRLTRRGFLKVATVTAGTGLAVATTARAAGPAPVDPGLPGVLVDTTRCAGCRACEGACAEANQNPAPDAAADMSVRRDTSQHVFTVINQAEGPAGEPRFGKKQCMHCLAPACASACPVRAMDKLPSGPVVYDASRCMGCRYCMVACAFDIPKYEYERAAPRVRKCGFCAERLDKGLEPACTSVCPTGAITFGKRAALLDEAKRRLYAEGSRYVRRVYGEHEAGGTSWLYISDIPFEKLALATGMPERPYSDLVAGALSAPPFVMTLWPPLLMGLYAFSRRRAEIEQKEDHHG
jgi:Fe-S-cluster-containing dehydrogenase component